MPRDLRIGSRVATPRGPGVVTSWSENRLGCGDAWRVADDDGREGWWDEDDLTPLPRDIPREHVEMLYAAVAKRVDTAHVSHCELSEVAEALRVLLEGRCAMGSDLRRWEAADRDALERALAERGAAIAERDAVRARSREAAQVIIAEIGADGPENVETSARRAMDALRGAIAERDRLRRELEALREHVLAGEGER